MQDNALTVELDWSIQLINLQFLICILRKVKKNFLIHFLAITVKLFLELVLLSEIR